MYIYIYIHTSLSNNHNITCYSRHHSSGQFLIHESMQVRLSQQFHTHWLPPLLVVVVVLSWPTSTAVSRIYMTLAPSFIAIGPSSTNPASVTESWRSAAYINAVVRNILAFLARAFSSSTSSSFGQIQVLTRHLISRRNLNRSADGFESDGGIGTRSLPAASQPS